MAHRPLGDTPTTGRLSGRERVAGRRPRVRVHLVRSVLGAGPAPPLPACARASPLPARARASPLPARARPSFGSCVDHLLPVGSRVCPRITCCPCSGRVRPVCGSPAARWITCVCLDHVLPVFGPCSACVWITCCPLDHVCVLGPRAARVRAVFGPCSARVWITCCPLDHVCVLGPPGGGPGVIRWSAGCPWERRLSNGGQVIRWEWAARGNGARGRGPACARTVPRPFLPVFGPCSACAWITCCPLDHVCVLGPPGGGPGVIRWSAGCPWALRLSNGGQVIRWEWAARGNGARGRGPARAPAPLPAHARREQWRTGQRPRYAVR